MQKARVAAEGSAGVGQGWATVVEGRARPTECDRFWAAHWGKAGGVDGRGVTNGDGKRRELEEEKVVVVEHEVAVEDEGQL